MRGKALIFAGFISCLSCQGEPFSPLASVPLEDQSPDATGDSNTLLLALAGKVSGLELGAQVALTDGVEIQRVGNGPFAFPARPTSIPPRLAIAQQPEHYLCEVDVSPVAAEDTTGFTTIAVTCRLTEVRVGGTVAGLPAGGKISLSIGDGHLDATNGPWQMPGFFAVDAALAVAVAAPVGYQCAVQDSSLVGVVKAATLAAVAIQCTAKTFPLTSVVAGLRPGGTLDVAVNGQVATIDGPQPQPIGQVVVTYGQTYSTTIARSPAGQSCQLQSGGTATVSELGPPQVAIVCHYSFANGVAAEAVTVLGQPNFSASGDSRDCISAAEALWFSFGRCGVTESGTVFLPNTSCNHYYVFNTFPTGATAVADWLLPGPIDGNLGAAVVANGGLWAASERHLVLQFYDTIPTADTAVASFFLPADDGNPTHIGVPRDVAVGDGRLWVADPVAHRVIVWSPVPTQQEAASFALGQPDLTSTDQKSIAANTLNNPQSVWANDDVVIVADTGNKRVLIWNSHPSLLGAQAPADVVLGAADLMTAGAPTTPGNAQDFAPVAVVSDGEALFVGDSAGHRVLMWKSIPTSHHKAADAVIGQADWTGVAANRGSAVSSNGFSSVQGLALWQDRLLVTDGDNNRVLVFKAL